MFKILKVFVYILYNSVGFPTVIAVHPRFVCANEVKLRELVKHMSYMLIYNVAGYI